MNLKYYTTDVPAATSIDMLERLLVDFGATNIMKEYANGECVAISFLVEMDGMKLPFKLPSKANKILKWLLRKNPKRKESTLKTQAYKIAWKQLYEWVHLQFSMIQIDQAEKLELFFPYLYDVQKQETYYEKVKAGKFKALITNG